MTDGIYNTRFIYYDESGKIQEIRPYPPAEGKLFLEIDFSLVEDFLFGKKSYDNYNIRYFLNLKNGIVTNTELIIPEEKNFLYRIPLTDSFSNEITLEHHSSFWRVTRRSDTEETSKLYKSLDFFICKKDNPNFLYRNINFNLISSIDIEFTHQEEFDLKNLSVLTLKKFKSYGIKEFANE